MVQIRKNAIIRRVKDITIGSTLSLALLGGMVTLPSCGNREGTTEEYETVYTKGVHTYITETEPGVFKITDEKTIGASEQSMAYIKHLDGKVDTLTIAEAQRIVEREATGPHNSYYQGSGLGNVLFYGAMGYMIGNSMGNRYQRYDDGRASRYYNNPSTYERSRQTATDLQTSRATRPSGSKSGFFGRSRGYGGG